MIISLLYSLMITAYSTFVIEMYLGHNGYNVVFIFLTISNIVHLFSNSNRYNPDVAKYGIMLAVTFLFFIYHSFLRFKMGGGIVSCFSGLLIAINVCLLFFRNKENLDYFFH